LALSSRLLLVGFALLGACSLDTRSANEEPIAYDLYGLFDSARYQVTIVGQNDTLHVRDSLRGHLIVYGLHTIPKANLSVAKCGVTCYGYFSGATPFEVTRARIGDSLNVQVFFDADRRIEFEALDLGDSLVGTMNSWKFRPGGAPIYRGRFVARRFR
jgi:hypothetical protein